MDEKGKALMDIAAIKTTDESNAAKQLQKLKGRVVVTIDPQPASAVTKNANDFNDFIWLLR